MKRIFVALILLLGIVYPKASFAQPSPTDLMGLGMPAELAEYLRTHAIASSVLANNAYVSGANATPAGSAVDLLALSVANDTILNALTGKKVSIRVSKTPEVEFGNDTMTWIGSTGVEIAPTAIAFAPGSATTPVANMVASGLAFQLSTSGIQYSPYVATPATDLTPVAGTNDFRRLTVLATAAPTNAAIALPASPNNGEVYQMFNLGANPVVVAALGTPVMNNAAARRLSVAAKGGTRCVYSSLAGSWLCDLIAALPTPAS